MTRLTLLSAWEQRHCPLSAPHAAARAPCIAFGKCQQEFKTTLRSSTALNVLVSGDEEKLKEERSEISHTIRHTAPSPSPHTHTHTHLPPIGPLEQAWWVRGWVVYGSLRVAEVVVGAPESGGRVTQEIGTHRPMRRRNCASGENFSGTPLRLSHLGFQMRTVGEPGAPVIVSCLLRSFVLSCVWENKEPIQLDWQN